MSNDNYSHADALTEEILLARYWQLDLTVEQTRQIDVLIASDAKAQAR